MNATQQTFKKINLIILTFLAMNLSAQIWDAKDISFPVPSQGWRVRPVDDNVAWTFGYSIGPGTSGGYTFTNSENTCQKTINGGEQWESIPFKAQVEQEGYICDVVGISAERAFVVYYNIVLGPQLFRTTDGGQTWKTNNGGVDYFLNWVHFYDGLNGIGLGDPGDNGFFQVVTTSDGGESWVKNDTIHSFKSIDVQEYGVSGEFTTYKNSIWTKTSLGRIFHSSDKGQNWQEISAPENIPGNLGLVCDENLNLYASYSDFDANTFQIFVKQLNSSTWKKITPIENLGYISGFSVIPGTNALILNAGIFGIAASFQTVASTNGGQTWNTVASNEGNQYGFVEFSNAFTGYACEIPQSFELPSNRVFKYNGSPLSGLLSQHILDAEVSVYPNPASDVLHIKVTSEKSNDYWILINDVNGSLLYKQVMTQGASFQSSINVSDLPVGAYILSIANKNGASIHKFIRQ
ncbi:MAG: T9SS type A sorting domain-containing protein [Saprospiraceae bacterium]|nr:T9SS type A sorting domain-containing protein [Saprospiraceae bacterium]